ncbi:interferon regulatory factor 4-like isoform X2 [Pyxicephalus adspersus]|uniref:interferon regulatory factor 4-like isoform X2 n=1 Tax=Pyxicephalus adspersus TaxID=30357 RepID=UPI003B59804F
MYQKPAHPLRLKEWLILQINSGKYPGLCWEDEQKTKFRIPWKHASKQDYSEEEDAALFKAWALYKGKFREGSSKADPSVWKTRLRCALNKSPDFQEVPESCQDPAEPYKIYRLVSELQEDDIYREPSISPVKEGYPSSQEDKLQIVEQKSDEFSENKTPPKLPRLENNQDSTTNTGASGAVIINDRHSDQEVEGISEQDVMMPVSSSSDFWLHIRLYYNGKLVNEVTTQTAEGCRIATQSSFQWNHGQFSPILLEEIPFPSVQEVTELDMYMTHNGPEPQYQIHLCFGEEYPEPSGNHSKLITAHVEPVFARELLEKTKMKLRGKSAS